MKNEFNFTGTEKQIEYANSIASEALSSLNEDIEMAKESVEEWLKTGEKARYERSKQIYDNRLKTRELLLDFYKHASAGEVIDRGVMFYDKIYTMVKKSINAEKLTYKHIYDWNCLHFGLKNSETV